MEVNNFVLYPSLAFLFHAYHFSLYTGGGPALDALLPAWLPGSGAGEALRFDSTPHIPSPRPQERGAKTNTPAEASGRGWAEDRKLPPLSGPDAA